MTDHKSFDLSVGKAPTSARDCDKCYTSLAVCTSCHSGPDTRLIEGMVCASCGGNAIREAAEKTSGLYDGECFNTGDSTVDGKTVATTNILHGLGLCGDGHSSCIEVACCGAIRAIVTLVVNMHASVTEVACED